MSGFWVRFSEAQQILCASFVTPFISVFATASNMGGGVHSDEAILRDTYAVQSSTVRLILPQDIWWLRLLNFRRPPSAWWWYFLNGNRFPWDYFRNGISLRQAFISLFLGLQRKMKRSRVFSS